MYGQLGFGLTDHFLGHINIPLSFLLLFRMGF